MFLKTQKPLIIVKANLGNTSQELYFYILT